MAATHHHTQVTPPQGVVTSSNHCRLRTCRRRGVAALAVAAAIASAAPGIGPVRHAAAERHIAAAAMHICVVQGGGGVACRGNVTTTGKLTAPANFAFHAVTVGDDFSCGLTAVNSSLRCWGALPGGSTQLPLSTFFVDAHAGPRHVCGLAPNGTIYCYGNATSRGAVTVPAGVSFQGVTAGADYTCGVARNHSVVCWGDTANPVVANTTTWRAITDAEHVAAGADHACYIRLNGSVACWGSNSRGGAAPPAALATNGSVWWLTAGGGMTCAITGSAVPGPVTCWGAVTSLTTAASYEVACAGWGCVAIIVPTGSSSAGAYGQVVAAAGVGGSPAPQVVGVTVATNVTVATLVGSGAFGSVDGVGSSAQFKNPHGVSLDGVGGLYVADSSNYVIRRVDIATRNVTTVAGMMGSNGMIIGPTPLESMFNFPYGVEADGAGGVYVTDYGNHAIRTLSGAWVAGSISASGGAYGSDNAAAGTSATFYWPSAVRADVGGGLLYVADTWNTLVRTIVTSGAHAVATLATLPARVYDIALHPAARVAYVIAGDSVFVVTYAGVSTLLAGAAGISGYTDDTGGAARFNAVYGLALDARLGVLYVAEYGNNRIRRVTTADGVVTTLAGMGIAGFVDGFGSAASFNQPWGITLDTAVGTLYMADCSNHAIRTMQLPPAPVTFAPAPLPPSPLAPTHQLTAWRAALGHTAVAALDARGVTFASPLSPANTAGLNPAIGRLLLGAVTLAPRNVAPAAGGNTNTTFSTSAQRGLRYLTLTTTAVPVAALALPALTNLTLAAPAPTQALVLFPSSFSGLTALTSLALSNITGVSWPYLAGLAAVPGLTSLDLAGNAIVTVDEHDFDAAPALRWLSLADTALTYVSDAAFSAAKQPALELVDQARTPLLTGAVCPPATFHGVSRLAANGAAYFVCVVCTAGAYCGGNGALPVPCAANTYATSGAAFCTSCPPGTYATRAAVECTACPPGLAAVHCNATASWRDTITVVTDGAGAWVNASLFLVPAWAQSAADMNVSCGPLAVVSPNAVSCPLPFMLPASTTAPVLTQLWAAFAGTGGAPRPLVTTVMLVPPPQVVVPPGGSAGLVPLTGTPGGGRIVLRLPASRLMPADWTTAGQQPPSQATIDNLTVWLAGAPCNQPAWDSSITISCAIPAVDGVDLPVAVQLAGGLFNVTGVLPSVFTSPTLTVAPADVLVLLPPMAAASNSSMINITLSGMALCVGQRPRLSVAYVGGLRCGSLRCDAGRTDAVQCVGWNASAAGAAGLLQYANSTNLLNATAMWANRATPLLACDACVVLATRPVLSSITPSSIGVPVVIAGAGMVDTSRAPPSVYIGDVLCNSLQVLDTRFVRCNAPSVLPSAPGYPVVSVVVINAAGAMSTEPLNLTYPVAFSVSWTPSPTLTALPGGLLTPAPTLRVLSREAATCSLTINVSSCATTNLAPCITAGWHVRDDPSGSAGGGRQWQLQRRVHRPAPRCVDCGRRVRLHWHTDGVVH